MKKKRNKTNLEIEIEEKKRKEFPRTFCFLLSRNIDTILWMAVGVVGV